jgi:leucyl-tRNA synthetase
VLYDCGLVSTKEPFQRLFNQGLIQAFAYKDETGRLTPSDEVQEVSDGKYVLKSSGRPVSQIVAKMSKSLKNVVNPDDVMNEYGADTLRLYEMFLGPLDASKPWNPRDIPGVFRFLQRAWRMIVQEDESQPGAGAMRQSLSVATEDPELERLLHKTIKKVTQDLERMAFNTAISALMVFVNEALKAPERLTRSQAERFVLLLAPFAPHLAEELYARLGKSGGLSYVPWPSYAEALTEDATKELAVQINGKIKARIVVSSTADDSQIESVAREAIQHELGGKQIQKVIVVKGRLVNVVIK